MIKRRQFLKAVLGLVASVYVPSIRPQKVPEYKVDLLIVDDQWTAYVDGRQFAIEEVARWFNIPPDSLVPFGAARSYP